MESEAFLDYSNAIFTSLKTGLIVMLLYALFLAIRKKATEEEKKIID